VWAECGIVNVTSGGTERKHQAVKGVKHHAMQTHKCGRRTPFITTALEFGCFKAQSTCDNSAHR